MKVCFYQKICAWLCSCLMRSMFSLGLRFFALLALSTMAAQSYAACVPPAIEARTLGELPPKMTVGELTQRLGQGCLGGFTAMTYQYRLSTGEQIWFWLKNKPVPAFHYIQSHGLADVEAVFATQSAPQDDGSEIVVWPKSKTQQSANDLLAEEYFSR